MPSVMTRTPKPKVSTKVTAAPKTPRRRSMTKAEVSGAAVQAGSAPALNETERQKLIAQAAYFRAEKRGFAPGCELQDWIEAEAEVQRLIGGS